MRTRKTTPADIPALKAIWNEAFAEDSGQDIDEFFENLYPNAAGFCAEDEKGDVCAMLFALPQTIVKGEKQLKASYLYAVATRKEHRGKGYCKAVMAYAEKELRKRYVEALLLSPATQALADFYARLGFSRQTGGNKVILDCAEEKGQATEIGVQDYAGLRETLLWDVPHVRYSKVWLDYEALDAEFYALRLGAASGCAAVQRLPDGSARVDELLPDERFLPALTQAVGAERYLLPQEPYAMCKWLTEPSAGWENIYLAFDFG